MSPLTHEDFVQIIAAAVSGASALVLVYLNYRSTKKHDESLETLRAALAERQAESDALRDYKYEARKRLYQHIEPLFFQLVEASEEALGRIHSLARTARCGDLRGADGWLAREGYYAISTQYKLLLPFAIVRLIRERLTAVDLAVDPDINAQYLLAKGLYLSFTDDFVFAAMKPPLPYDPNRKDWREVRATDPAKYSRQGIPLGHLDNAVDALIRREGPGQWLSFGEFHAMYKNKTPELYEKFDHVATVVRDFHPRTRPVFWRMLITQAHIYQALVRSREMQMRPPDEAKPLVQLIEPCDRAAFDWRAGGEDASEREALAEPFDVAQQYLRERVGELFIRPGWSPGINS